MDRILAIFPGALGDFVCFLPALEEVARQAEVELVAKAGYAELLRPRIRVRSLDRPEVAQLFAPRPDQSLKEVFASYASIYSWMGSGDGDFARNLRCLSDNVRLFAFRPLGQKMHLVDYYLSCLGRKAAGDTLPHIPLSAEAVAWSENFLTPAGTPGNKILAVAPGSGAREKNWPLPYFLAVTQWWRKTQQGEVLVIAGPVEEERGEAAALEGAGILAKGMGLAKLAALLSRCDVYLGNDSGVTHLAAALGVPTVALFGPTEAEHWRPCGPTVALIRLGVECSPCDSPTMKACPHRRCLTGMSVDLVVDTIARIVSPAHNSLRGCDLDKVTG